jgi:hypothetical protein
MFNELSVETRTLYAELMERVSVREARRNIGNLDGAFSTKTIAGKEYIYFQCYVAGGSKRSICLGAKSAALEELAMKYKMERIENREDPIGTKELCSQLIAGRVTTLPTTITRVVRELAESSIFRAGGVLVGTQAFAIIGNLLGVRWDETTLSTQDIDVAIEKNVSIAVPGIEADVPKALESLSMGFLPVPRLNNKHPSTSFSIRKSPVRVDLLTPKTGASDDPVHITRFNAAAQPLSYLGYLIEEPIPAVVIGDDAIAVQVPQPLKFAMHKLMVSQLRDVTARTKAEKDIYQAFQIISFYSEERPYELREAWNNLIDKGSSWKKYVERGLKQMEKVRGKIKELSESDST